MTKMIPTVAAVAMAWAPAWAELNFDKLTGTRGGYPPAVPLTFTGTIYSNDGHTQHRSSCSARRCWHAEQRTFHSR